MVPTCPIWWPPAPADAASGSRCASSNTPCRHRAPRTHTTPARSTGWSPPSSTRRPPPPEDLAEAYAQRWEIESVFDEIKTHQLDARPVLRSRDPDGVEQEILGILLVHHAIRDLI